MGRGRFPKSPALRLMRIRWGIDGGGDGLCWASEGKIDCSEGVKPLIFSFMKAYCTSFKFTLHHKWDDTY